MPETRLPDLLRRYPLFAKLADAEVAQLAERMRTRSFKRGEALFRKDDPGMHLYVVLVGAVTWIGAALVDRVAAWLENASERMAVVRAARETVAGLGGDGLIGIRAVKGAAPDTTTVLVTTTRMISDLQIRSTAWPESTGWVQQA